MYTRHNYRTKKELRADVKAAAQLRATTGPDQIGWGALMQIEERLRVYERAGRFKVKTEGFATVEGPHYPEPHHWWAAVELREGIVFKVIK